jgi:hypothetical protein
MSALRLKVEAQLRRKRARRNVVCSAKGGEEVVQRDAVRDVDRGQLQAPFVFVAVKQVIVADGHVDVTTSSGDVLLQDVTGPMYQVEWSWPLGVPSVGKPATWMLRASKCFPEKSAIQTRQRLAAAGFSRR